eukprot:TRINITY_DN16865_c0_g1_i1.p1 TRINITY_DN16865_c0_g1~~TRINITY_DN16865_c0_g1_i1.p1  ORF type:complete len:251 (-),score=61.89 TRINITY_DN16865_c0_g1_i1:9-761(-)
MEDKDISENELTEFIKQYDVKVDIPEGEPTKMDCSKFLELEGYDVNNIKKEELEGGLEGYGIILKNVLSRKECKKILEISESIGYGNLGKGNTGNAYRGNRRLQIHDIDERLGKEIWRRISHYIPLSEEIPEDGKFIFDSINPRYRFAKYYEGNGFAIHVDKPTVFEKDICSVYTVNIYLNDLSNEQGGRTRFYKKMTDKVPVAAAGGEAGSIAIFKQSLFPYSPVHDGEKVNSGLKYLMRTDLIYKRQN